MRRGNGGQIGPYRAPTKGIISLSEIQQFNSVPAITYLGIGGGGGGASALGNGPGSGGGYLTGSFQLQRGRTYAIEIGAGGTGSSYPGTNDTNGSATTFLGLTAEGGIRGTTGTNPPNNTTNGLDSSITGTSLGYGGRGGAGGWDGQYAGGPSFRRSGIGGLGPGNPTPNGYGATANSGSGGGAGGVGAGPTGGVGGPGGSGVAVLSIPVTIYSGVYTGTPVITLVGNNIIMQFNSSGTYTA